MLSALLIIPMVGAAIVGFFPLSSDGSKSRQITLFFTALSFGWSLYLLQQFNLNNPGFQFQEYLPWADAIGLSYSVGVDGLSLPLLILNSFLTGFSIFSIGEKVERSRLYYSLILLCSGGIAGALMAQNLLLFVLFYELELIPFYLMIAVWGGEKRGYAATKFLIYTALSGLLVLAAFLGMAFLSGSANFDYPSIHLEQLSLNTRLILLTLLLVGFGIKNSFGSFTYLVA